jgi:RNA methyltransferase, TrmH family
MRQITSVKNQQVKDWRKLFTKKERDKSGLFLVEGFHLVEEALRANLVQHIVIEEKTDLPRTWNYGELPVTMVTQDVLKALSETETPQGVVAICYQNKNELVNVKGKKLLLIDAVQDPGNLGTMIRTADAAGMDAVIIGNGSVDLYNAKVLRSAQGSHFHLPVLSGDLFSWVEKLKENGVPIYGTSLENGADYSQVEPNTSFALLVGNEGNGVNKALLEQTTKNLYIPIYGKSESLNVAVAAGVLMYFLRK